MVKAESRTIEAVDITSPRMQALASDVIERVLLTGLADGLASVCLAGCDALDAYDRDALKPGSLPVQAAIQLGL